MILQSQFLTQIKFIFRFGRDVGIFIHKCGSGYVEMRKNILSNSQPSQSLCRQKLITKCLTDLSFVWRISDWSESRKSLARQSKQSRAILFSKLFKEEEFGELKRLASNMIILFKAFHRRWEERARKWFHAKNTCVRKFTTRVLICRHHIIKSLVLKTKRLTKRKTKWTRFLSARFYLQTQSLLTPHVMVFFVDANCFFPQLQKHIERLSCSRIIIRDSARSKIEPCASPLNESFASSSHACFRLC